MSENIFLRPADYYQRNINPLTQYVEQTGFYLSKMTGKALDDCKQYVIEGVRGKKFEGVTDPQVDFFERGENGDRYETSCKLSTFISTVVRDDLILAPTFTCYVKSKVVKSLLSGFTSNNSRVRAIAKKEAAKAKAAGNYELFVIKNNEQDNRKRSNNSLSGSFVAGGSVVNNPTAHSTLTSITRTVGSLGNASNEKIIMGNRHYRNADVTLDNLIFITANLDRPELEHAMQRFQLVYPSVEQVIECVRYSSDLYWIDPLAFAKIQKFVEKLEPIERAAIVYVGDFYHLRKYNEEFVRKFVTQLARKVTGVKVENAMDVCKKSDEMVMNYVHQICITQVRGIGKDYSKLSEDDLNIVAATAQNVENTINEYRELINAIFLTKNVPSSTAYIPGMIRRSVVLSDTDSTMFSIDDWVKWYFNGDLRFDDEGFALSGAVMFIATQSIAHVLAVFSANMSVERENLFLLAMKPEYVFPVFAQSSVAKHYYTMQYVKEGNVHKKPEMEIKGVHLKNSAAPKEIVKAAAAKMEALLMTVMNGNKISIIEEINEVIRLENQIIESLTSGKVTYLKTSKIKNKEAYALGETESPYQHHTLWTEVFGPKYGVPEQPPYGVIKIPTTLVNKTKLKAWLDGIPDRELAQRMFNWLTRANKTSFGTFYVSKQYAVSFGIPPEIVPIIDMKKIVLDLTNANRMILGTLGYCPKVDWLLRDQVQFDC
jgi:hypothetical protein